MLNVFRGQRPDITPIQTAAIFVAGIPIVSNVLSAFDVFTMNTVQQDALGDALTWGGLLAAALVGGDAAVRIGRNVKDGKVQAAEMEVAAFSTGNVSSVTGPTSDVGGHPVGSALDLPHHEQIEEDPEPVVDESTPDDELAPEDVVRPAQPSEVDVEGEPDEDEEPVA